MLPTLTPPPRHVPLSLRVLNLFNVVAIVGWFFFAFGMIFFWVFAGNADLSFLTFTGPHARTRGKVTKVEDTNASENRRSITANHYEFSAAGAVVQGKSYESGSSLQEGADVTIEYDEKDPSQSRIVGMRRAMFGPWPLFVTIFPLVGLLIIIGATKSGLKRTRLLREGLLTTGKLIHKSATNTTVNDRRVYELKFEFTSRDGRRGLAVARTSMTERLQDEMDEPLLYDPQDIERAFMLDELPSRPALVNGELQGRPVAAILASIIPVGALVVHGFILWLKMKL